MPLTAPLKQNTLSHYLIVFGGIAMFCRFCGSSLPVDSSFCASCGKSLAASDVSGAAAAPAPAKAPVPPLTAEEQRTPSKLLLIAAVTVVVIGAAVFFLVSRPSVATVTNSAQPSPQPLSTAISKPRAAQPAPELSPEELYKQASPSVLLIEVFNKTGERIGTGSGFVAADGTIVTNYHVIRGAYSANARLQDGSTVSVQGVLGSDQHRDLAVLKVNGVSSKPLVLGDSEKVQVGDKVIAIGSPRAIQNTLSDGIVSGIRNGLIQTSAPISPGSSGGPLFNKRGEVVGITVAQIIDAQNINFALPINWAKTFLNNSEVTSLDDLANQNTVEEQIIDSTISVPAHQRRAFPIFVNHNSMADAELDGTFSSTGGVGDNIRVFLATPNNVIYDSGRTASGEVHLPLQPGTYQLVIDNTGSVMFPRSVTADFKFHYVK